jgi:hypothetical protein
MPNHPEIAPSQDEIRVASLRRSRDLIPVLVLLTIVAVASVSLALARFGADIATLIAASTGLLLLLAITRLPANRDAWSLLDDGRSQTSLILEPLVNAGWIVLRDRRVPLSRATIDHVAIGPTGAWAIETRSRPGRARIRAGEIWLDGERTPAVAQALRTAGAIQGAAGTGLEDVGMTTRPVLCFHRARLPRFRRAVQGVALVDGRRLVRLLSSAPGVLDAEAVRSVAAALDKALPAQVRAAAK